jgi:small subunit ribosomal protein S20
MPQIDAAKKDLRKNRRRRIVNDRRRQQLRTALRAMREAIGAKDKEATGTAYSKAQSALDRAARHHVIHRHKAARKKAGLRKEIAKA